MHEESDYEGISGITSIVYIIFLVKCFLDLRIKLIFISLAIIGSGLLVGKSLRKHEHSNTFTYCLIIIILLFVNRGIGDRIYDEASVISFMQDYNLNSNLVHESKFTDHKVNLYVVTSKTNKDIKKIIKKIKKKKYYYIVILYFDNRGSYVESKYSYRTFWGADDVTSEIDEKVNNDGIKKCLASVPELMRDAIAGPPDDMDSGDDDVGTHWVDDYYRSDGTHVDGYERSNPDGNPNNNLGSSN